MIIQFNIFFFRFHVSNGRLRLYLYAGNNTHFTFTYKKVSKADSLQPFGCNGPQDYQRNSCEANSNICLTRHFNDKAMSLSYNFKFRYYIIIITFNNFALTCRHFHRRVKTCYSPKCLHHQMTCMHRKLYGQYLMVNATSFQMYQCLYLIH